MRLAEVRLESRRPTQELSLAHGGELVGLVQHGSQRRVVPHREVEGPDRRR